MSTDSIFPFLIFCFTLLLAGCLIGSALTHYFMQDGSSTQPKRPEVVYMDHPASQKEVEKGTPAVPHTRTIFLRDTVNVVEECVDVPDFLEGKVDTTDVSRETKKERPFTVLPEVGGVTSKGGDIELRHYDVDTNQWVFDHYRREPVNAWVGTAGIGVLRGHTVQSLGIGRRTGRWTLLGEALHSNGEWGAIGHVQVRF